jgi:hypothetical protein
MTTQYKYKSLREKMAAEKEEREERYRFFSRLVTKAHLKAHEAVKQHTPTPMHVTDGENNWVIDDGVCGFAEVRLPKGNTSFARWAKKNTPFEKHYGGGLYLWVSDYNQSMERKEVYARTYADVLNRHGIDAYSTSRMD